MDCAANHGHAKVIKLLIDCDAPIDPKDRSLVNKLVIPNVVLKQTLPRWQKFEIQLSNLIS